MIHLGIIPDGNRRWSKQNSASIIELLDKIKGIVVNSLYEARTSPLCNLARVGELTVYVLSKDNLIKRNGLDPTIDMIRNGLDLVINGATLLGLNLMKIQFVGELHALPTDVLQRCRTIESLANAPNGFVVTVGIGYDPVEDTRRYINQDDKREQRPIDMVIRSGGEHRSSGFFPMHTLYSEWFYLDKLIPDITFSDIDQCIGKYLQRNRRFGA